MLNTIRRRSNEYLLRFDFVKHQPKVAKAPQSMTNKFNVGPLSIIQGEIYMQQYRISMHDS